MGRSPAWVLWHRGTTRTARPIRLEAGELDAAGADDPRPVRAVVAAVAVVAAGFGRGAGLGQRGVEPGDRAAFFGQFAAAGAVQYFYEPFLQAFDPELRKQLGVWYTPPEIVRYMVARVDAVLREELGIADGLADPQVFILDPCCGTGAYLTEVLRHIKARLDEQGLGGLAGARLKQAALERVFGFELLPAPYVVAHLQLGCCCTSGARRCNWTWPPARRSGWACT